MSDDPQLDQQLTQHFGALRTADARRAPAFATMLATAQQTVAHDATTDLPVRASAPRARVRMALFAVPVLAAAAALVLMLRPRESRADREFEALVSEWSRTSDVTRSSPTDALLSLPGDQYLRGMPPILESDRLPSRSRSSS